MKQNEKKDTKRQDIEDEKSVGQKVRKKRMEEMRRREREKQEGKCKKQVKQRDMKAENEINYQEIDIIISGK